MAAYLWFIYALLTAVFWGFAYVMSEHIIKNLLPTSFFIFCQGFIGVIVYTLVCYLQGDFKAGFNALADDPKISALVIFVSLIMIAAWFLVLMAIQMKNAALVNIVEITYPFFTLFFAWLIFRDVQMSLVQIMGGLLMFAGATLIIWKS
ncbi:MAG: EamA family transporter [Pseudomonadota bacterium]